MEELDLFVAPNEDEKMNYALKIEEWECEKCRERVRFPRYNHPHKLLETRRGRNQEWCNAFNTFCVTLGYDTRMCVEWDEDYWTTEIFIPEKDRWVHFDCCNALYDLPLTYERDHEKDIKYVIAFSQYEIADVTFRYVSNKQRTMIFRNMLDEQWL